MISRRQPPPALLRDERGFTMVEVIATIVIMSIVLAIASSTYQSVVEGRRVDSATNQLVADLRLAHTSATNQLTQWHVVYNAGGSPVTGCGGAAAADYCLVKTDGSTAVESKPRYLPDGTELSTNLPTISPVPGFAYDRALQFQSDGTARTSGALLPSASVAPEITVRAEDDAPSRLIQVNLITSRVQVDS